MPLNKLKKYPELLVLSSLNETSRTKSLRGIFDRDISDNDNFKFMGKRIYPIKSNGIIDMDREFMHLTTEEIEEIDDQGIIITHRVYDSFRSERLHWIKPHTEAQVKDSDILVFSVKERNQRKRIEVVRTYIYNKTRKYVIVFEPQTRNGDSYYLLTAYYLNKTYGEKQIKKKLKARMNEVL
ncbi:MAG: hypothetical protein IJM43_11035 [Bacteroidaceae bacterium]|nr:hypothetical protein [Bacteroidaceae bacterium]